MSSHRIPHLSPRLVLPLLPARAALHFLVDKKPVQHLYEDARG